MQYDEDRCAQRINYEVILYAGCTLNEISRLIKISLFLMGGVWLGVVWPLLGSVTFSLMGWVVSTAVMSFSLMHTLKALKRDKPLGYYEQYMHLKLSEWGLIRSLFLTRTGEWSTERYDDVVG